MKWQVYILSVFLFMVSCSEPDLVLDNELDPDNPDFDPPNTTILAIDAIHLDSDGLSVDVQDPIIKWVGNEDMEMEFRNQLDGQGWSDWSSDLQKQLEFLNEGDHRFLVQGRYLSGTLEDQPDTLDFIVDAITGPALRMSPLKQKVSVGDSVLVEIMAEEMAAVSGAEIIIKFNHPYLTLVEDDIFIGEFFYGGQVIHFKSITEISSNVSALQLDIAVTGGNITTQDGVIARLRFSAISPGDEKRVWFEPSSTTVRDADNIDIWTDLGMAPVLVEGLVDIE